MPVKMILVQSFDDFFHPGIVGGLHPLQIGREPFVRVVDLLERVCDRLGRWARDAKHVPHHPGAAVL